MLDKEQIKQLRSEGKTYQFIANLFGVTRQRIEQVIHNRSSVNPELREKILTLRSHKCIKCGKNYEDNELEIHHLDLNTKNNEENNLYVTCKKCHKEYHANLKRPSRKNFCHKCGIKVGNLLYRRGKIFCEECWSKEIKRPDAYKGNCIICGKKDDGYLKTRKMCRACYSRYLYKVSELRRKYLKESSKKWKKNNPDKAREINRKAVNKYNIKNREMINKISLENYYKRKKIKLDNLE